MTDRPIPTELLHWTRAALAEALRAGGLDAHSGEHHEHAILNSSVQLRVIAGDASSRRYFRVQWDGASYIVVEAPPATENNEAFVMVREILHVAGVKVPRVYALDYKCGYLLLEDLGDRTLLPELNDSTVDAYYTAALAVLGEIASVDVTRQLLAPYDSALLSEELEHFPAWFVEALLGYSLADEERQLIQRFNTALVDSALEQPRVLVHRDFHSRNLMLQPSNELAVIDFQDAVVGPVSYDLVSLLRDCYIRWPEERVQSWALAYLSQLQEKGRLLNVDDSQFLRWFDWMGLQRHIKVLGIFARLYLRDGKPGYLDDLPRVIAYVEDILQKYAGEQPVFAEFQAWFQERLSPLIARQNWANMRRECPRA